MGIFLSWFSVGNIKDICNILFFIIIVIISILTYKRANKTIFSSFNTETFKLQLTIFNNLIEYFQEKKWLYFYEKFDMKKIFYLNFDNLLEAYVKDALKNKVKIDEEKRKDRKKDIAGFLADKEYAVRNYRLEKDCFLSNVKDTNKICKENIDWNNYVYGEVAYTKKFDESLHELNLFIGSPLMPTKIKTIISEFREAVYEGILMISEILTDFSKELNRNVKTGEDLLKINLSGVWNLYSKKVDEIGYSRRANEILKEVNRYLKIDKIINYE